MASISAVRKNTTGSHGSDSDDAARISGMHERRAITSPQAGRGLILSAASAASFSISVGIFAMIFCLDLPLSVIVPLAICGLITGLAAGLFAFPPSPANTLGRSEERPNSGITVSMRTAAIRPAPAVTIRKAPAAKDVIHL